MARSKKNIEEPKKEIEMQNELIKAPESVVVPVVPRELSRKEIAANQWAMLEKEEVKLVRGRFRNLEMKGADGYVCASKFKDVEPFMLTMEDEQIYEIPLYAARYINQNCSYPNYKEVKDEKGKITLKESIRVQRYVFEPLNSF